MCGLLLLHAIKVIQIILYVIQISIELNYIKNTPLQAVIEAFLLAC